MNQQSEATDYEQRQTQKRIMALDFAMRRQKGQYTSSVTTEQSTGLPAETSLCDY